MPKKDDKQLTVKLSYNENPTRFFIDFWDGEKYIVSVRTSQNEAEALSRELGIKILLQ
jgi:hypothetical protein